MRARALLIEVRWPGGRFHGVRGRREPRRGGEVFVPEWPPSPFRLFQALVAGAYGGRWAAEDQAEKDRAFHWLERLEPPVVSALVPQHLRPVRYYVPNNDLDTKGGDPARVDEIRVAKTLSASLFGPDRPARYLWRFDGDEAPARKMVDLADRLHTLGRGIDAAFARAEVLDAVEGEVHLLAVGGAPMRPAACAPAAGLATPCPTVGSLASLHRRHEAFTARLTNVGSGAKPVVQFRQPPKPHARAVAHDRAPIRRLYELSPLEGGARFRPWALARAAELAVAVRDQAARELHRTWPAEVERFVTGRRAGPSDVGLRLRILPLPSIGTRHTDPDIRRVLVEIPPDHPIPVLDLEWALAGRELVRSDGTLTGVVLAPSTGHVMLDRYGAGEGAHPNAAHVWHTVTPAALPWRSGCGRTAGERATAEAEAAGAVVRALRHAGVTTPLEAVRVQREPFDKKGERADRFMSDRFDARDLRHVEVRFARPTTGPLALGNGRWLGLGVVRPIPDRVDQREAEAAGLHAYTVECGPAIAPRDVETLARALRRAIMARAQASAGARLKRREELPTFFTGHAGVAEPGQPGAPAAGGRHEHLFFAVHFGAAGRPARLLVIAPHRADRNPDVLKHTNRWLDWLVEAAAGLTDLRAGRLGRFALAPTKPAADDQVLGRDAVWASLTPYRPTRHPRRGQGASDTVILGVLREAERRGLPKPEADVVALEEGPRSGLRAQLRLTFATAVAGPILLGQGSHFGAGLFGRNAG